MAAVRSASFSGEMVVMTENSKGRSIRQTWRALRHERLMSRPARRDRRVQLEACDQGVSQKREIVRPNSMVLEWLNLLADRSERNTSELPSLMRHSYDVFCLKKKTHKNQDIHIYNRK